MHMFDIKDEIEKLLNDFHSKHFHYYQLFHYNY